MDSSCILLQATYTLSNLCRNTICRRLASRYQQDVMPDLSSTYPVSPPTML